MSRTRSSILNYTTMLLFTATTLAMAMFSVPLLLRWLGEERYGAVRAMTDWYGYLALCELGLSGGLLPLLSRAVGKGDGDATQIVLLTGIKTYLYVTVAMLVSGLVLALLMTRLIPVSGENAFDLHRAALIFLLSLAVIPLGPMKLLLEVRQRGYKVNILLLFQGITITGLALFFAWRGLGITGQVLAIVGGSFAFYAVLIGSRPKRHASVLRSVFKHHIGKEGWRELWKLNIPALIRQLCGRVGLMSNTIIVAGMLGPALVVPMLITQRLSTMTQEQLQGIGSSSWAALGELHSQGRLNVFNQRLIELTSIVAALGVAVLTSIIAYNHHFVGRWVGEARYAGDTFTLVASAGAFLLAIVTLWDWCFTITGHIRKLLPMSLLCMVINLVLSVVFTRHLGILGPLLGTLVAVVIAISWYLIGLLRQTFGTPLDQLAKAIGLPLVLGIPYAIGAHWFARAHEPAGWVWLASEMAATTLLYLVIWWAIVPSHSERNMWMARLRLVLASATA
jgi:O-antigen/teichoic acid export membrane protein